MAKEKETLKISRADYDKWSENGRAVSEERHLLRHQNGELRKVIDEQGRQLALLNDVHAREGLSDFEVQTLLALARPGDIEADMEDRAYRRGRYGFHPMYGPMDAPIVVVKPVRTPLMEKAERALEVEFTRRGIFPAPLVPKVPEPIEPVTELTLQLTERRVEPAPTPAQPTTETVVQVEGGS